MEHEFLFGKTGLPFLRYNVDRQTDRQTDRFLHKRFIYLATTNPSLELRASRRVKIRCDIFQKVLNMLQT